METPIEALIEQTPAEIDSPVLDVNPENVCQLIQLARDFHAQDAVVVPDEPESSPDDLTVAFSAHSGNPILEEFRNIIADLDRGQQVQLVALMWVGRGDYDADEWDWVVEEADAEWTDYTADYLLAHPLVAEQLRDGLEMFGYSCD